MIGALLLGFRCIVLSTFNSKFKFLHFSLLRMPCLLVFCAFWVCSLLRVFAVLRMEPQIAYQPLASINQPRAPGGVQPQQRMARFHRLCNMNRSARSMASCCHRRRHSPAAVSATTIHPWYPIPGPWRSRKRFLPQTDFIVHLVRHIARRSARALGNSTGRRTDRARSLHIFPCT